MWLRMVSLGFKRLSVFVVCVWFRMVSVGFKRLSVCVFGSKWYLWALIEG